MNKNDLTQGSIKDALRRIAIPSSIGFLFNTLFNVVDTYYAGQLSVSALANETVKRNLASMLDDVSTSDITIVINQPDGSGGVRYVLKGAQFDSESSSIDIGSNRTVDLSFSAQVGGPNTTNVGVFMSGSHSGSVFQ